MKYVLIALALSFSFLSLKTGAQTKSQDPGWQWGRLSNVENSFRNLGIRSNLYNDIYSFEWYIDSIYIEDTVFMHTGGYPNNPDFHIAVVKRNSRGEFIKALDLYTPQNKQLYYADMEIDNASNIYIYGSFEDTLFIDDTIVLRVNPAYGRDIYLVKLDKDLNFLWAKQISTPGGSGDPGGIAISKDNYLYVSTYHMIGGYDTVHLYINFFNQDSTEILSGLISLLNLDTNGNIIWRDEIRKSRIGYAFLRNIIVGEDGNIYLAGNGQDNIDFYIQGDTVHFPTDPDFANDSFVLKFDPDGKKRDGFFLVFKDFTPVDTWLCVDRESNYYISAIVSESMVFGSDYIEVADNEIGYMIAKMDPSFNPIWNQAVVTPTWLGLDPFQLNLVNDSVAFAFNGIGHFDFMDTIFSSNNGGEILLGLLSPEGKLDQLQVTDAFYGASVNNFIIDNCNNILLEGTLSGTAHFGSDTIIPQYGDQRFLAKSNRNHLQYLDMPADTAGCGSITLLAPEGYLYYQWNDELSNQESFIVNSTGIVNLKAANEDGCWSESETTVDIYPLVVFSLGTDTTILLTDTLKLYAPGGYENYLWSTGDTIPHLEIPATGLEIGDNLIWLDIDDGHCSATDTILIKVVDNSFIPENNPTDILLYPNPASTYFRIISRSGEVPESVIIYNYYGTRVKKLFPANNLIDISSIGQGVYVVELVFHEFTIKRKLIIL
jgi:hypothetical protein